MLSEYDGPPNAYAYMTDVINTSYTPPTPLLPYSKISWW